MRVCQFRHFGTEANLWQSRDFRLQHSQSPKAVSACQCQAPSEDILSPCQPMHRDGHPTRDSKSMKRQFALCCLKRCMNPQDSTQPAANDAVIPEELALEIRKLAHDLSNALEIIVQTGYLLSTADLKSPASDWLRMLDNGVNKALEINADLRSYVKAHTPR